MNNLLQALAKDYGCIFGICDPSPLPQEYYAGFTPFVSHNIDKRTNPAAVLPGVKSIVVVGVGWSSSSKREPADGHKVRPYSAAYAKLSSLGTNPDYHPKVKSTLRELANNLPPHTKYKILVDSPNLDERAFAHRAGIGFFGRNGLIISPQFGSRFNIGLLLTDIPLEEWRQHCPIQLVTLSHQLKKSLTATQLGTHYTHPKSVCPPDCNRCIAACPTGALSADKPLETTRCISYLTQKPGDLSSVEKSLMGSQLYGCDICQDVCPFNQAQEKSYADPQEWLVMDDIAFTEKYGHTGMLWQGAAILRRNAQAVVDNSNK